MPQGAPLCDFTSAILVGRTCRRLKRCSDAALDQWADIAASRRDQTRDNYDASAILHLPLEEDGPNFHSLYWAESRASPHRLSIWKH